MDKNTIIENLRSKSGITELNAMQRVMADTDASDIMLHAPTGSGKTVAFTLYMLGRLNASTPKPGALVLAPSRELVLQIYDVVRPLATRLKCVALYGGHSMTDEVNSLSVTPDIVIATPGRLLDHIQRRQIDLTATKVLVLDEYDKSLELGFADEMSRIVRRLRSRSNTVLTSATRLQEIPDFIDMKQIETVDFTATTPTPRSRMQIVEVESPSRDKLDTLIALLHSLDNQKVIVFVNHRESAERVHAALVKAGFPAGLYHGGLEQRDRQLAIDLLDNGTTPILVSTDLASRGLDIAEVGSVIHYHLPPTIESWTHRNGRTARQAATGTVYAITSEADSRPDFVSFDRPYSPGRPSDNPIRSDVATIYFNVGKKEKISRGDIAGYLINRGGLTADEVGKISLSDHSAIATVPRDKARDVVKAVAPHKLKNTRVRVTQLKG